MKQTGRIPDENMVHLCLYKVNQINFENAEKFYTL